MTAEQSWNQIKKRYLSEIEKSLAPVDPAVCRRIVSDVNSHLDQRLSELADDQKTHKCFKEIIEDMGPAEDYAQFLSNESPTPTKTHEMRWFLVAIIVTTGIFFTPTFKTFIETRRMTAQQLSHKAWQQWRSGQYNNAEKYFNLALGKDQALAAAWNGLGWSQFHLGKFELAQKALEHCIRINDQFSGAWNGLGHIASAQQDTDRAVECWKKAIDISPDATSALSALAQFYMDQKQYNLAIEIYEKWLDIDPDEPTARAGIDKAKRIIKGISPQLH